MRDAGADRLRPLDSSFLLIEDGITHMHIGACAVFEGPPPTAAEVVALVAGKLPVLGHHRQRFRLLPTRLGRPEWVDDPQFDLARHVRHATLPRPGREDELRHLMGEIMAVELDRHRPLWELWIVDGLVEDEWALIFKVHHCMADGITGTDLLTTLLDIDRRPAAPEPPSPRPSARERRDGALVAPTRRDVVRLRAMRVRGARPPRPDPRRAIDLVHDVAGGALALRRDLHPAARLSIDGAIGPARRWGVARGRLDDLKAVRAVLGGTINDVALAVIAGAFRDLLLARGDPLEEAVVRTLVPVSVRPPDDRTANNQLAAMVVELPVHLADPAARFIAVRHEMARVKSSHEVAATAAMTALAGFVPPMIFALAMRSAALVLRQVPQRRVNTVTTNVPGPQVPLYALGREMLEYLPFVPIAQGLPIGTAIISYNGQVRFGITADDEIVPELAWFCTRIEAAIDELTHYVDRIAAAACS